MNNNQLIQISAEIDNFLIKLATENEVPALNLTAVVLARLAIMCDDLECRDDMNKLLTTVATVNKQVPHATLQ
jgi:thiamine phosphate synthase YjbQ (UPF0047 family)